MPAFRLSRFPSAARFIIFGNNAQQLWTAYLKSAFKENLSWYPSLTRSKYFSGAGSKIDLQYEANHPSLFNTVDQALSMIRIRQPKLSKVVTLLCATIPFLVLVVNYRRATPAQLNTSVDPRVKGRFHEWKQCIERELLYLNDSESLWLYFWKGIKLCETLPSMQQLVIRDFKNRDDTKRHILSLQKTPSIIVTLGIGHDTAAEEALRKVLPKGSQFYGADPMHEINEDLYSKFGTFLPFAVGAKSGILSAKVLIDKAYVKRDVVQVELVYFLTEIIGHKVYDNLWIDTEGAEYDLFAYFYRDGKLDQNGITICQFNMEIHQPNQTQKELIRAFFLRLLEDNRYAFFRPRRRINMRLYYVNFADQHCVSKYIFRKTD